GRTNTDPTTAFPSTTRRRLCRCAFRGCDSIDRNRGRRSDRASPARLCTHRSTSTDQTSLSSLLSGASSLFCSASSPSDHSRRSRVPQACIRGRRTGRAVERWSGGALEPGGTEPGGTEPGATVKRWHGGPLTATPSQLFCTGHALCRSSIPPLHRSSALAFVRSTVPPLHRSTAQPLHRPRGPHNDKHQHQRPHPSGEEGGIHRGKLEPI